MFLMARKFSDFLRSQAGIAGLEMAICFPLFVIIFYQYFGVSQNLRLLSNLEKATACLGDVLVNAKPDSNMEQSEFLQTVMNVDAQISNASIEKAFKYMIERQNIKATIRISYQQNSDSELVPARVVSVNGGSSHYDSTNDASRDTFLRTTARNNHDNGEDSYKGDLLMVHACVDNPERDFSVATKFIFPEFYCSSFFAPRRK